MCWLLPLDLQSYLRFVSLRLEPWGGSPGSNRSTEGRGKGPQQGASSFRTSPGSLDDLHRLDSRLVFSGGYSRLYDRYVGVPRPNLGASTSEPLGSG